MRDAKYPFLSANITSSAESARPDWATPWTLITEVRRAHRGNRFDDHGDADHAPAARNVQGLAFGDGAAGDQALSTGGARRRLTIVIVVAHAGATCDRCR